MAFPSRDNVDILGPDDHIDGLVFREALIDALEFPVEESHSVVGQHHAVQNIGFADEIRHKGVLRLIIDILRFADLLDAALVHDDDGIGHGQCFFLIVGHIDERDAQRLLDPLQLVLHILAQAKIQSAQGFIQEQHLGSVDQCPGDGHPLLLTAGKAVDVPVFVALQADDLQHFLYPGVDFILGYLGHPKAEGDVVVHVQMREQGIALEDGIDLPLVGRDIVDRLSVEGHRAGCGL